MLLVLLPRFDDVFLDLVNSRFGAVPRKNKRNYNVSLEESNTAFSYSTWVYNDVRTLWRCDGVLFGTVLGSESMARWQHLLSLWQYLCFFLSTGMLSEAAVLSIILTGCVDIAVPFIIVPQERAAACSVAASVVG